MAEPSPPDLPADERSFFLLSLDMLCLANTDGYFTKVNPAFTETLGWSEEELLTRRFLDFVHPADIEATIAEVGHLAAGRRTVDFANRYRCADGTWRWLDWRASADPVTGVIYAVARDVTDLRAAHDAVERARDAAERANRSKSTFLANMSHELRTPLNAIIGFSELLQEDFQEVADAGDPRARQTVADLEKIHSAGRHLLDLINQVLDLSKVEAGRMEIYVEPIDLAVATAEAAAVVRPLCEGNGNQLVVDVAADAGTLHSDRTKVRQILLNLLANASRFTENGEVRLTVTNHPDRADQVRFEVRDTGIGLDPASLDRLFEPFAQGDASTTRRYGGTGLGLGISRRFCELLGGEIGGTSAPGQGATFWFTLPRQIEAAAPSADPTRPAEPREGPAEVLVIDDEPASRELAARILANLGYRVVLAESGPAGIRACHTRPPALVLLDVLMPEMDGWAVLRAFEAVPGMKGVPIVLMSALGQGDLGFALGVAAHLSKPVDPEDLSELLARFDVRPAIPEALIVDDDPDAQVLLARALERSGWRSRTARDGRSALDAVAERAPDLLLLDLGMPGMDGFELLERLRAEPATKAVPVIIVTARDLDRADIDRLHRGASRILSKGANLSETLREELAARLPPPRTAL